MREITVTYKLSPQSKQLTSIIDEYGQDLDEA